MQQLITSSVAKQNGLLLQSRLQLLLDKDLLFAHLSSNLVGDLLVQTGGLTPGSERIELIRSDGSRRDLDILASGPLQLLPAGGGVVVPAYNGLALQPLVDTGQPAQMLPGSRELGAFCAASGRAVLIRHWPDYRRSIELVIPGLAPQELLLGEQAVLAVACNGSGKRVWAVLGRWQGDKGARNRAVDGDGNIPETADTLDVEVGTPMQFDPVSRQLLVTLTQPTMNDGRWTARGNARFESGPPDCRPGRQWLIWVTPVTPQRLLIEWLLTETVVDQKLTVIPVHGVASPLPNQAHLLIGRLPVINNGASPMGTDNAIRLQNQFADPIRSNSRT